MELTSAFLFVFIVQSIGAESILPFKQADVKTKLLVRVAENYRRGQLKHAVTEEQAYLLVKPENNWDFDQKQANT
jgi:hypothetical protein